MNCLKLEHWSFTMAEILISLTIIGVIAAITLPALQANINESTWKAQRKALYSRMSQAISMLPSLNGYGVVMNNEGAINETETANGATQAFITDGLSTVIKIKNICDITHLKDCNINSSLKTMANSKISVPQNISEMNSDMFVSSYGIFSTIVPIDTEAAAFETSNGESVLVYYNPLCTPDMQYNHTHLVQSSMCANFIYDLNGKKGPNIVGKDIGFMSAIHSTDSSVIAPEILSKDAVNGEVRTFDGARNACVTKNSEARLPNRDEIISMFYNKQFIGINSNGNQTYWSGTKRTEDQIWVMNMANGVINPARLSVWNKTRCVKR